MSIFKDIFTKTSHDVSLANPTVPNYYQFGHIVIGVILFRVVIRVCGHTLEIYRNQQFNKLYFRIIEVQVYFEYIIVIGMSSQDLNQSRFLFEELNLDDEPTEEEVLQRAQELQIEDLNLARESLIRELDPEWKPYCNRKGDVYYINLLTKKAYVDHPIDMIYKQMYAKQEGLQLPHFRTYRIQDISQSIDLIRQEIQVYETQKFASQGLNIVYEEPSQQQKQSIYRSPSHNGRLITEVYPQNENEKEQLQIEQKEELYRFQSKLLDRYTEKLREYEKNRQMKYRQLEKETINKIKVDLQMKVRKECEKYEKQLEIKNKFDEAKIINSLTMEEQKQQSELEINMNRFRNLFEKLREKQRNIEKLQAETEAARKIDFLHRIDTQKRVNYRLKIETLKAKMSSDFNKQLIKLAGTSSYHQEQLKKDLYELFSNKQKKPTLTKYELQHHQQGECCDIFVQSERQHSQVSRKSHKKLENTKVKESNKDEDVWMKYGWKKNQTILNEYKVKMPLLKRLELRIV